MSVSRHVYICENCFGPMPMLIKEYEEQARWGNVVCRICLAFDPTARKPRFPLRELRLSKTQV